MSENELNKNRLTICMRSRSAVLVVTVVCVGWGWVDWTRKFVYSGRAGADPGGGGALGPAPTPGTEGPAPKARVPSSQGQKEGTLVSVEWLFNTIQA